MSRHRRFADGAGFSCHCWECDNSIDWHGEFGRCGQRGITVGKYDSPNNCCSKAGGCGYYAQPELRREGGGCMSEHIYWRDGSGLYMREPITRCRDCKHFDSRPNYQLCRRDMSCDELAVYAEPNGFCAWGERREDE